MEKEKIKVKGEELLKKVREIIQAGNARRIIIKNEEGKTYLELPITVGLVGAFLVPVWAAIGALAALASHFTIEVQNIDRKQKDDDIPEAEVVEETDEITMD